jgi:hypothetical protein
MTKRCVSAGVLLAMSGIASGQDDAFWINPEGGVWFSSANWSGGVVPNNAGGNLFNATLDLQDQPYAVLVDSDVELENFSLLWGGATLDLGVSTFTVNQNMTVAGGTVVGSGKNGSVSVGGQLLLDDAMLMNAGTITSFGTTIIAGSGGTIVCDTGVDHRGPGELRLDGPGDLTLEQGGSITNGSLSTMVVSADSNKQIVGDGTGTLRNEGSMVTGDPDRGDKGSVVSLSGVIFENTGTVTVAGGGLVLNSTNNLAPDDTLSDGVWNIRNGSFLDFGDSTFTRLAAEVNIAGADSSFAAIAQLGVVEETGRFSISEGQDFTATRGLSNQGEIEVGAGSTFDTSDFGLGNIDGDALFGGKFIVAGTFLTGASDIRRLEGDLTLVGEGSSFSGIGALREVGDRGRFALEQGRTFVTEADLTIAQGGAVRVGAASALDVAGRLTNNEDGVLRGGRLEVLGAFTAQNLDIREVESELILEGANSGVFDETGADALRGLNRVGSDGQLRLRDGRSLNVIEDLDVENLLSVEGARAVDRTDNPGLVSVSGNLHLMEGSTLELIVNGSVPSLYGQVLAVTTEIDPGATLSLIITPGSDVGFGDQFFLLQTGLLDGAFSHLLVSGLGDGLDIEFSTTINGVFARVVPAPGAAGLLAGVGLMAARRRR